MAASEKATELLEKLEGQVEQLRTSDQWQRFLRMQARMHKYSFNNVLLIGMQRPDATHVAGFRTWQDLGRHVRRGEKGIAILVPWTGKETAKDETTGEETVRRWTYFRVGYVFDVSQTDGPDCVVSWGFAKGDAVTAAAGIARMTEIAKSMGFRIRRGSLLNDPIIGIGTRGYCSHTKHEIVIDSSLDDAATMATLAHELAHAVLHDGLTMSEYHASRGRYEVEAQAIAYVVGTGLGLEMEADAIPYIAGWSKDNPKLVREVCGRIQATAAKMLEAVVQPAEMRQEIAA